MYPLKLVVSCFYNGLCEAEHWDIASVGLPKDVLCGSDPQMQQDPRHPAVIHSGHLLDLVIWRNPSKMPNVQCK